MHSGVGVLVGVLMRVRRGIRVAFTTGDFVGTTVGVLEGATTGVREMTAVGVAVADAVAVRTGVLVAVIAVVGNIVIVGVAVADCSSRLIGTAPGTTQAPRLSLSWALPLISSFVGL